MRGLSTLNASYRTRIQSNSAAVRSVVVLALAAFSLLFTFWSGWGSFEFGLVADDSLVVAGIDPQSAAAAAHVHVGDQIDRASVSLEAREFLLGDRNVGAGARLEFRVARGSETRDITLVARPSKPVPAAYLMGIWVAKCVALLFVSIGAMLVLMCPGILTWAFFAFCIGVHPEMEAGWQDAPPIVGYVGTVAYHLMYSIGFAGLVVFAARFPHDRASGPYRILEWTALPIFLLLFGSLSTGSISYFLALPALNFVQPIIDIVVAVTFTLACGMLLVKLARAHGEQRASLVSLTIGVGVGGFAGHMLIAEYSNFFPPPLWLNSVYDLSQTAIPICAAYAIVRHHALNLGFVANRVLFFGLLTTLAGTLVWTLDLLISRHLANSRAEIALYLGLALAAGGGFQAFRSHFVRAIDRVFFRQRYSGAMKLDRIRAAALEGSLAIEHVAAEIAEGFDLASLAVFRRSTDGGFVREAAVGWPIGTAWHLLPTDELTRSLKTDERQVRLAAHTSADILLPAASARPTIALPLKRGGRVEGVVLIGQRARKTLLDREEVLCITALFTQFAAA